MKMGDRFEKEPCTKCCNGKIYDSRIIDSPYQDEHGKYILCGNCQGTGMAIIADTMCVDVEATVIN